VSGGTLILQNEGGMTDFLGEGLSPFSPHPQSPISAKEKIVTALTMISWEKPQYYFAKNERKLIHR